MIAIDGSFGEGGGQILRTSLALSVVTGKPFRIRKIRAGRKKPGLGRQHLTAVGAAAEVSGARVSGDALGSQELTFTPGPPRGGSYRFDVGTAGSCTLVLQTVLPALLLADVPSELTLEGGTHNPFAPPFEFLERALLPLLNRMGPEVTARLRRAGFYPAGGGRVDVSIRPCAHLAGLQLRERGTAARRSARALVSGLPLRIAERELKVVRRRLSLDERALSAEEVPSNGPGNVVMVEVESEQVTEVFTAFGRKGLPAERVARAAASQAAEYLESGVPIGRRLADQLLLPLALAGGGSFRTLPPTDHSVTNIEVIGKFLDVPIRTQEVDRDAWEAVIGE